MVRDVHRLKKMTQELYPGVPYFILGHSMGSFITRNYIYRYGTGIQGAIIMGIGMQSPLYVSFGKAVTSLVGVFHGKNVPSKFLDKVTFGSYNKRWSRRAPALTGCPGKRKEWTNILRTTTAAFILHQTVSRPYARWFPVPVVWTI